jgi:hypothetical protein
MGYFNFFSGFGIDPSSGYLWGITLGGIVAVAAAAITFTILFQSIMDWRRDFLYNPTFPLVINFLLMMSRLFYLAAVQIVLNKDTDGWRCTFQGFFVQFFDTYALVMIIIMTWSACRDAVTIMVSYPDAEIEPEQVMDMMNHFMRLSRGGALGIELDPAELLRQRIVARRAPKLESSSDEDDELLYDEARAKEYKEKDQNDNVETYRLANQIVQEEEDAELQQQRDEELGRRAAMLFEVERDKARQQRTTKSALEGPLLLAQQEERKAQLSKQQGQERAAAEQVNLFQVTDDEDSSGAESGSTISGLSVVSGSSASSRASQSDRARTLAAGHRRAPRPVRDLPDIPDGDNELFVDSDGDDAASADSGRGGLNGGSKKKLGRISGKTILRGGGRRDPDSDESATISGDDTDNYSDTIDSDETLASDEYGSYSDEMYSDEYSDERYGLPSDLSLPSDWDSEDSILYDYDPEAESTDISSDEDEGAADALATGFFGFFCGDSSIPAGKMSRRAVREQRFEELQTKIEQRESRKETGNETARGRSSRNLLTSRGRSARSLMRRPSTARMGSSRNLSRGASKRSLRDSAGDVTPSDASPRSGMVLGEDEEYDGPVRERIVYRKHPDEIKKTLPPEGLLALSYPARVTEVLRRFVTRPIRVTAAAMIEENHVPRRRSKYECIRVRQFVRTHVRREETVGPARDLSVSMTTHSFAFMLAAVAGLLPLTSNSYGFIGYTCSIQEGGAGVTPGKAFLLLTYYGAQWIVFFISQFLHFVLHLVKSYSYPATANGSHFVDVTIRRLSWYPITLAVCFIIPTSHAWFYHQHDTLQTDATVLLTSTFHMWSLQFVPFFFALGLLIVEVHIGKRDRRIVKGDPLTQNPKASTEQNLDMIPEHMHMKLARDRFWLLMNTLEERRFHVATAEGCTRCKLHNHRYNLSNLM